MRQPLGGSKRYQERSCKAKALQGLEEQLSVLWPQVQHGSGTWDLRLLEAVFLLHPVCISLKETCYGVIFNLAIDFLRAIHLGWLN